MQHIIDIDSRDSAPRIKRVLYELSTAFTPELSVEEIIARMVLSVKSAVQGDRVGLFVLSEDKRSMVLTISERSKGVRLPVRGLAGAVLLSNESSNIPDAYQDPRFDNTMDKRTGYRTRQVLGVPLRHPLTKEPLGLLQVNNRADRSHDAFSNESLKILEVASEQLSELLDGRTSSLASDAATTDKHSGTGGASTVPSHTISQYFKVDVNLVTFQSKVVLEKMAAEGITILEIVVSLHLALTELAESHVVSTNVKLPPRGSKDSMAVATSSRVQFDMTIRDVPRAARILFRVRGRRKASGAALALGWAAAPVYDFKGAMDSCIELRLFDGDIETPITTTLSNGNDVKATLLSATLAADFATTVDNRAQTRIVHAMPARLVPLKVEGNDLEEGDTERLDELVKLSFNPMSNYLFTEEEKEFVWELRLSIIDRADLLPALVMSVPWKISEKVQEFYDLLDLWKRPAPVQALQLLDRRFMDPKVRAYACMCLEELEDEELMLYMLQLCQQLKFESFIDSALARFLLRRALLSTKVVGHIFFWLLQSEVYLADVSRRFTTLLQIYIKNCGKHRIALGHQMFVMKRLEHVAQLVTKGESKKDRLDILKSELKKVTFPPEFCLPLNPSLVIRGIDVERCRVMESKKKPLWLTFRDSPGPSGKDIVLMLKVGDDLRQDALIMQLLRMMNDLWTRQGLLMQMKLYDAISTGYERGLLQVVLNSNTLANILLEATDEVAGKKKTGSLQRKIGSAYRALTSFSVFKRWIWTQIEIDLPDASDEQQDQELAIRVKSFVVSTAAYCVASYVLGLGDRHNDNLMMTRDGHFFHIDFGHILGNFKKKLNIKRERAPFVFTNHMKEVIGDQYEDFVGLCCDCYNILRDNATLLVSLFTLAIPCNLPELQREKDVMWIYEKLQIGLSNDEAAAHFRRELDVALETKATRVNDMFHMLAHA